MRYLPLTTQDRSSMLATIGAAAIATCSSIFPKRRG